MVRRISSSALRKVLSLSWLFLRLFCEPGPAAAFVFLLRFLFRFYRDAKKTIYFRLSRLIHIKLCHFAIFFSARSVPAEHFAKAPLKFFQLINSEFFFSHFFLSGPHCGSPPSNSIVIPFNGFLLLIVMAASINFSTYVLTR